MLRRLMAFVAAMAWPALAAAADLPEGAPEAAAPSTSEDSPAPTPTAGDVAETLRAARADIEALALGSVAPASPLPARETEPEPALPPSLTSDVPAAPALERAERAPSEWLAGIALPDFPVRWSDELVSVLEYYRDDPRGRAHITAWLERSGRYEAMIRRTLREAGLPEDLLYVAMVESGFNPTIESPARAVGLWQFVQPTAIDYGLTIDRWIDERKSPERATEAAARFLADLHADLGSWPLALAAYNMGYASLKRTVGKYNTNDFSVLARLEAGLPYETIVYVHKITACAIVGRNLDRFGLAGVGRDAAVDPVRVSMPGGTGLGAIARAAGMSVEDLAALNPELRRNRIPPDVRDWPIRIPRERLTRFQKSWPSVRAARPSHAEHVLRFGERLKDVAEIYDTSLEKLRRLNDLAPGEEVKPGTRLRVPDVEPITPEREDGPVTVGVPDRRFDYPDRQHVFYRVLGNETLQEVAKHFQVEVDDLQRWNDVTRGARLPEGLVLQLYVPKGVDLGGAIVLPRSAVDPVVVGSEEFFDRYEADQGRKRIRYRVKPGDTLTTLAKRFDLTIGSIARINGFSPSTSLAAGREIVVYVPADAKIEKAERKTRRD